jgi:abortive infection alpha-like protein
MEEPEHNGGLNGDIRRAAPGLVRIGAAVWWRTASWTAGTSIRVGSRVLRAAVSGESAAQLLQDTGDEIRGYVRSLLGLMENLDGSSPDGSAERAAQDQATTSSLRRQGEDLLRRSADVRYREDAHPAYERILGSLAPDEGRILRLLVREGPQPAVDVRATKGLNIVNSQLVAPGLSMIGAEAGCRYLDRVPAYFNNLERLGLIWFSRESLEDPLRYQVLEAQPDVIEALSEGLRSRTVRRSIQLTPFGEDFCRVCLPLDTAELDALPGDVVADEPIERSEGPTPGELPETDPPPSA